MFKRLTQCLYLIGHIVIHSLSKQIIIDSSNCFGGNLRGKNEKFYNVHILYNKFYINKEEIISKGNLVINDIRFV